MSDIQEKILELMDLFDEDEVTTADKINRPEPKQSVKEIELFNEFNIRNPKAGGGMLVQPSADGRRPGYSIASEKVINFAKQFKEKNGDLPTQQEIMKGTGAGSSTIKRHLKEGVDFKKVLSPKETGAIGGKKSGEKSIAESGVIASDDKEGLKKLQTKVNKLNRVNNLKNKGIKFNIIKTKAGNYQTILSYLADIYREKLNKTKSTGSLENLIEEFNQFRKTSLFKNYDKGTVMREAGIKSAKKQLENIGSRKLDVFEYLLNNKNATMEEIGKALKIKSGVVRKSLQGLYTDIYKRAADQGAVFLKNYNINQLDSVHDSIKNTKVSLKDRVKNLVIDAYKGDKNLKPILKKLDDFYALNKKIKKTQYGKFFAANLDHVVPLNFLRQLEEGADPFNLIKLRPIPEFLNQRAFKAQFDKALGQAYANRLKPGGKEALETIVNLQSYLPKEFGGITPDGKIINYGAKPFSLKTDLSQSNFNDIYKRVFEFIKNPELQETFKESKVSFKNLLSQEKNIMKQSQSFNALLEKLGCGKSAGGRILKSTGGPTQCALAGKQKLEKIILKGGAKGKELDLAKTILRAGSGLKNVLSLRGTLGPAALAFTVGTEAGLVGYDMLTKGETLREAFGNSLFNYALGKDYQIDSQEELFKRFKGLGYDNQQIGSIKRAFDTLNTINTGTNLVTDFEQQFTDNVVSRGQPEEFMMDEDQFISDTAGQRAEQNLKDAQERLIAFNQSLKEVDRPGGMKKEDVLNEYFSSGKYAEDLKLATQAEKEANLQKLTSAGPKFVGSVFPKFEQQRQIDINKNLGVLVNPAFDIPGMKELTGGFLYGFADGGLSGGDKSGPPPESGPTPHGLPGILKRVKNI